MKIDGTFGYWVILFAIVGYAVVNMCVGFWIGMYLRRSEANVNADLAKTQRTYIGTLEKALAIRDQRIAQLENRHPGQPGYGLPN